MNLRVPQLRSLEASNDSVSDATFDEAVAGPPKDSSFRSALRGLEDVAPPVAPQDHEPAGFAVHFDADGKAPSAARCTVDILHDGAAPLAVARLGAADSHHVPDGSASAELHAMFAPPAGESVSGQTAPALGRFEHAALVDASSAALPRRAWLIVGATFLVGLVISFYLGYQQRRVVDFLSRAVLTDRAPAAVDARIEDNAPVPSMLPAPAQVPVAIVAAPIAVPSDLGPAPNPLVQPAKPDTQSELVAPGPPQKGARGTGSRAAAAPRSVARQAARSAEAAAAVAGAAARPMATTTSNEGQPSRYGPCTAGVAALGLCTPEATKGGN